MDEERGRSADRPSWWQNLAPRRWRPEAPASEQLGPAGSYAERQVEQRLQSPEWNTEARSPRADDAAEPARRSLGNRPTFRPDGHGSPPANRRPYPA